VRLHQPAFSQRSVNQVFCRMARPLRIEYPGAFFHVMHRGNAGSDIFKSTRDREKFLKKPAGVASQLLTV